MSDIQLPLRKSHGDAAVASSDYAVKVPQAKELEKRIRRKLNSHLKTVGFIWRQDSNKSVVKPYDSSKESVRLYHRLFRQQRLRQASGFIKGKCHHLLKYFADGGEVCPKRITPVLETVLSGTVQADLFRLASLTWSIPVSEGFGRRMRFLVWDQSNGKLIGLLALGDPVFNLRVRDKAIGWSSNDRKERLVYLMDAYVLGAIPPYNMLLCGKLIACLVRTLETWKAFHQKYNLSCGIISGKKKRPELVMVTTTSSLGRSSVYNRLRLGGIEYFQSVGYTSGYGHFHVPDELFEDIREYLKLQHHPYSKGNRFGQGPNWKLRTIRAGLGMMNVNKDILFHGIRREVFLCCIAVNAYDVLQGKSTRPDYGNLISVEEVGKLALERWIYPRAERMPDFRGWKSETMLKLLSADY